MNRHKKILEYALSSLMRRRFKNLALIAMFTVIIAVLASILFLTDSVKKEALAVFSDAPQLIIQRLQAGRHDLIPTGYADTIKTIAGVGKVSARFWGYYYDPLTQATYTIMAHSPSDKPLRALKGTMPQKSGQCAVGQGVANTRLAGLNDSIFLTLSQENELNLTITGIFSTRSSLLTNDLIIITEEDFLMFFAQPANMATDLTVEVFNDTEVSTVAAKIKRLMPQTRPISRNELIRTYDTLFSWRGGMALTMFAGALAAFTIFAWDKATGLSADERREIGILKALGWETADVLTLKFWEGFTVSILSFLGGVLLAWVHVYFFGAPVFAPALKGWSVLFPAFNLPPHIDVYNICILFFLTVLPYVASTVIPSWKAAITDPDVIMRM